MKTFEEKHPMDRLDDFIEYAQATRKFHDVGFYLALKAYVELIEASLSECTCEGKKHITMLGSRHRVPPSERSYF